MLAADEDGDEFTILDGRQSPVAAAVQRGVCRLLKAHGFATVTELPLATGRRVDVMAINGKGAIWVVEIKSCLADLKADGKWPEYEEYCDRLYFAVPSDMPLEVMPASPGLIIADQWGAEIVRECPERTLPAARRKAVTLRFARAAALRLHFLH
ncbi:MAG: MmcB family DNA repair protein, partial [Pseudomonadota bacterium]